MARICIVFGLLLCGLTTGALVVATRKNPENFIPMMLGIPILFCGVVALNPHRLKLSLRFALAISVVGLLVGGSRVGTYAVQWYDEHPVNLFAFKVVTAMTLLCLVFAGISVFFLVGFRQRRVARAPTDKP